MQTIGTGVVKYKFTILGAIAGGLLSGNIWGILVLGFVGFVVDMSLSYS